MKRIKFSDKHPNRRAHNWIVYDLNDKWLNYCLKYVKGDMVDLGCGEMPFKSYFDSYTTSYTGVEWTESLHEKRADIMADLNKPLPILDCVADTLLSISVMEHLCEPQIFLNESNRILKKSGIMILQVPWQWMIHEAPYDFFRYSPYGLKYLFENSGFTILELIPTNGYFTSAFLKFNYFTLRIVSSKPKLIRRILKIMLLPVWYLNQFMAPYLDKLDKNWERETQGFIVIAQK